MRNEKIWYYIAAGLCVLGLILCMGTLIVNDFSMDRIDPASALTEKQYETETGEIKNIVLDARDFRVEVRPASGREIRLTYYESEKIRFQITERDGILRIDGQSRMKWYDYFAQGIFWGLSSWNKAVVLEIPTDLTCGLDLSTSNGAIHVEGFSALGKVALRTSNGEVTAKDLSCASLEANTSNGTVGIERTFIAQDGRFQSSNGRLWLADVSVQGTLTAGTSNGEIAFEKLRGPDLSLSTSNGAVYGSIDGVKEDYTILSSTSNGGNNLGNQTSTAGKSLNAETTNGNIDISFNN